MSRKKPTIEKSSSLAKKTSMTAMRDAGTIIDEAALFGRVAAIIENRKARAGAFANCEVTLMYWEVGQFINSVVLDFKRAEYGKLIVTTLSIQLVEQYGNVFGVRNIRRMAQFADEFPDIEIVSKLSTQLSWSHFVELLPVKSSEARMYYAEDAFTRGLGVVAVRRQISRKAFERREIANAKLTAQTSIPFNVFKDPYLLDILGLKENFLEADLEKAILTELEAFILEFGHGFTFVERQKRMIVGGEDIFLDLLFYHRILKRLVAVELKLGVFKAAYKGQMELYLNWLDENEKQPGEEPPIGIILCATANREKVEMLKMDKAGIAVAEYWTELPPKAEFERKIKEIMYEARERLARRKSLPLKEAQKQIDYFIEAKGDEDE
jgi:predicted nuclease of restriction endonuclease-like (RecB) superfamily